VSAVPIVRTRSVVTVSPVLSDCAGRQ
jgi:hypothetical protein